MSFHNLTEGSKDLDIKVPNILKVPMILILTVTMILILKVPNNFDTECMMIFDTQDYQN